MAGTAVKPWFALIALMLAAAIVVLDVAAAAFGAGSPWLLVASLVANLAVLGAVVVLIVRADLRATARENQARAETDASRARFAAVMDSAMDAIITVDDEQRIVLFNQAAEAMFRCRRDAVLGATLDQLLPARFRGEHAQHIRRFGATGVTNRRMGDAMTLWAQRADGAEFPIEASISQVVEGGHRLYTVILRDITRRKEYEDMLARQQAELREISARVLQAREEEKTLLARELHDELGQQLTAMKMDLAWLRERLPAGDAALEAKAAHMTGVVDQTMNAVRRISADLRPLMLDDLGLHDATAWLVDEFTKNTGVDCRLDAPADAALENVDRAIAITVYRVLQESLTNITRHAQARHAWVILGASGNWLQLEVEDDGKGIADADLQRPRSLGLKGIRERVLYLGGSVEIGRAPRGGTRVLVRIPKLPMQAAKA